MERIRRKHWLRESWLGLSKPYRFLLPLISRAVIAKTMRIWLKMSIVFCILASSESILKTASSKGRGFITQIGRQDASRQSAGPQIIGLSSYLSTREPISFMESKRKITRKKKKKQTIAPGLTPTLE